MNDLILVACSAALIILSVFLGLFISKKFVFTKQSVVFIGWRKKNRAILRDERLIPAHQKTRIWTVWMIADACTMFTLTFFEVMRDNWTLVFGILAVGAAAMIGFIIAWRISWVSFNKLKDELGVVLEYEEDTVQKEFENIQKIYHPFFVSVYGFGAVIFMTLSITKFLRSDLFLGIVFAGIAIYYVVMLIINIIQKKKSGGIS